MGSKVRFYIILKQGPKREMLLPLHGDACNNLRFWSVSEVYREKWN